MMGVPLRAALLQLSLFVRSYVMLNIVRITKRIARAIDAIYLNTQPSFRTKPVSAKAEKFRHC